MVDSSKAKGGIMDQLHKRFTPEQIRVLLQGYCQGTIERASVEETLGIGKTLIAVGL